MSRTVIVTIPAQRFEINLDNLGGEDWCDDEIYDYVIHPTLQEAKSNWEVIDE